MQENLKNLADDLLNVVNKKQSIREWILENYESTEIEDITKHGCSGGIGGLIYYNETCQFHDEHEAEIWDMLYQDAEDLGNTIPELIASFNGAKDVGSMEQFKNLLTWYAVERTCRQIVDEWEDQANLSDDYNEE